MAFVRVLAALLRDKQIGPHIVPIIPDESRTFGMEGMFRQHGIYSPVGQLYRPQDSEQLMFYKEDQHGQILEEGITEAGSVSSFIAAGTSYSAHGVPMVPFYIYYSMFGYQRVGDLIWAAGDSRARGFLLGGTAGRTTLNGEGLQHQDGHSHVLFSVVPNVRAYDPAFGYELAVIVQDGLRRMVGEQEDVFFYITLMNENYTHPAMPEGAEHGILRGMYRLREGSGSDGTPRAQLLGSGTILREVLAAGGAARVRLGGQRRRVERHLVQRAAPRWPGGRPLEHAAPDGGATERVRVGMSLRRRRPGRRVVGLHPRLRRPHPGMGPRALPRPRDRRVRSQRLPPLAAQVL